MRRGKAREKRYQNNLIAWQEYRESHSETPFIEGQNDMQKIAFGGGFVPFIDRMILGRDKSEMLERKRDLSACKNACEVIALYNCFVALHEGKSPFSFPDLLGQFEKKGILFGGLFGTSMKSVARWSGALPGYEVCYFSKRKLQQYLQEIYELPQEETREFSAFIVSFWNKKNNPFKGIHTVCITRSKNGYVIHNLYENNRMILTDALEDALLRTNGEDTVVCAIGINKR